MLSRGLKPTPIEFFKLVTNDEKLQEFFCYCNRKEEFYDFEIVNFKEKNENEYITVSKRGIIHFIKGIPNFISVYQFEREANIYKKIKGIKFFNLFKCWKNFSNWKTLMRRTMFNKTKAFLKKNLFLLDGELQKPLLDLKMKSYMINKLNMQTLHCNAPCSIKEFQQMQDKHRKTLAENLTKIDKDISVLLTDSCNASMRTFKEENRIALSDEFFGDDQSSIRENNEDEKAGFLVGDETHKQMPYTQEATLRTHYKLLSKFIRLTDFMIVDARLQLIQSSINQLYNALNLDLSQGRKYPLGENKIQACGFFEVTVEYDHYFDQLQFTPQCSQFIDLIRLNVVSGLQCVKSYQPYLKQKQYEQYANVVDKDEIFLDQRDNLTLGIGESNLGDEISRLSVVLQNSFEEMKQFTQSYERFFKIYKKSLKFDVNEIRQMEQETISSLILKLARNAEEIDKMDVKSTVRIFKINGDQLKQRIKDCQIDCLNKLKSTVPKIQFDRFQEIYVNLSKDYAKIASRPRRIDEYVALMTNLRELTSRMDHYSSYFHETERIGLLMEEHKIKFPERNRNKLKETQSLLIETKRAMVDAFESSQQHKLTYKKELIEIEIPLVKKKIEELKQQLNEEATFESESTPVEDALKKLDTIGEQVKKTKERGIQLNQYQKFLDLEETQFELTNEVYEDWQIKHKLWYGVKVWNELQKDWLMTKFSDIDVEEITKKVEKFSKIANTCSFTLKKNRMGKMFKESVDSLKATMPVVTYLRDEALQERHWQEIFAILGMHLDLNDQFFTLNQLIELNVQEHKVKLEEIAMKANQEMELDMTLEKLNSEWKKAVFETKQHKESYYILVPSDSLNTLLEESLAQLSKMLAARFIDRVKQETELLYKKLHYLENLLQEWLIFQRSWMYLENIFNSADIASKMGQDSKRFFHLDHLWKDVMKQTHQNPLITRAIAGYNQTYNPSINIVLTHSSQLNYLEIFKESNQILDDIQKSLEILLEKKRTDFPRFYFLSNDDLLQLLSKASKDPYKVQHHLRKLFENIISFTLDMDDIINMTSLEGEQIKLKRIKAIGSPVERWLQGLLDSSILGVKKAIKEAHNSCREDNEDFKRSEWVIDDHHTAQALCIVDSITWCGNTEQLLKAGSEEDVAEGLHWWLNENIKQLKELTSIIAQNQLEIRKRQGLVALITQDVHYRDVIDQLLKIALQQSLTVQDYTWQQQLRYYYLNEELIIRQVNASFDYGYEYLGATTRIVITPLTDRCWITITGALHYKLGAAPSGPAGTGKTESTKDLAKALGKYCVVFNCSDQINYKMMELLFIGLSMTGSWACLDEFNRINIEVLSVIAQQLQSIRQALLSGKMWELFLGEKKVEKFIKTLGVFVTMNPGYKGRTELPDNLKVLFRPVSMMIPDYALIAEIMLFSEGFHQGKVLSKKMTKLYKLSSEQLSQQIHYDFGMRAVKSVLIMAGQLKQKQRKMPEELVLIKAIRDSNVPKFIKEDLPLFNAIVQDLFPGQHINIQRDELLINAIQVGLKQNKLAIYENQIDKAIQLSETINVRFGVMIIGQNLTGKSSIIKILKSALNILKDDPNSHLIGAESQVLNPKSLSLEELYGNFSHVTQEWTDGLASYIIRKFVESKSSKMKWVIFDGPVDAIWIENMNTVLDDNMTLCLSNGERIKLRAEMRIFFEIDDLSQASPATVSRCGMVYTSQESLNWKPIVQQWLENLNNDKYTDRNKDILWNLFELHINNTIDLLKMKQYKEAIQTSPNNLVISLCRLIESILQVDFDLQSFEPQRQRKVLTKIFSYSLAWTFGGSIDSHHHSSFEVYLCNAFSQADMPKSSVYDNFLFLKGTSTSDFFLDYQLWIKQLDKVELKKGQYEIIVPTKDIARFSWLAKTQLLCGNQIFLTGVSGVGKSLIMQSVIKNLREKHNYQTFAFSFSSHTQSSETQFAIEDKLERRRRNMLGGHYNKKVVIYIDDINMPSYDQYGTQKPIELLRQFLDYKGLYDRNGHYWKHIVDTTLCCSAAPPEGGRKVLSSRFTSHFHVICIPPTQEESLYQIVNNLLQLNINSTVGFRKEIIQTLPKVAEASILMYLFVQTNIRPTPQKSHYSFNLRDIKRIILGICQIKSQQLSNVDILIKLWIHEVSRVYLDRLISEEDKNQLLSSMVSILKSSFRFETSEQDVVEKNKPIFCDFIQRGLPFEERYYQMSDSVKVQQSLSDYLDEYNITYPNAQLNIILFEFCVDHILRLSRILRQKRQHALLVGVCGSGKQSISKLSTFICQQKIYQIQTKSKLTLSDFRDCERKAMLACGLKNQRAALLITDSILDSSQDQYLLLEDINSLLVQGDIPQLWNQEDKDKIQSSLKKVAQEQGIHENIKEQIFVKRVRDNIHILICMSPIGEAFKKRIRMFPSLINTCQIDWYDQWPQDALFSVGLKFIEKNDLIQDSAIQKKISHLAQNLHSLVVSEADLFYLQTGRKVYLTQSLFLDFLKTYNFQLEKKFSTLTKQKKSLQLGCEKLIKTNDLVIRLTESIKEMQPMLQQSVVDTEQLSIKIEQDKQEAAKSKSKVEKEKTIIDKQTEEVQFQYNLALQELQNVLPILQEAEQALDTLNQSDITELRLTKFPSKGILNTMIVTFMLLEKKSDYRKIDWKMCQHMMSVSFFEKLKSFDKEELVKNDKLSKSVEYFIYDNNDFTPEIGILIIQPSNIVRHSSKACYSLCKWCFALINYQKIARQVAPKQIYVQQMDEQLKTSLVQLAQKQQKLNDEMVKLQLLEKQFQEVTRKRNKLFEDIEQSKMRIERSKQLTNGLEGESIRWNSQIKIIDEKAKFIIGESFIAAAIINYFGPFSSNNRKIIFEKIKSMLRDSQIHISSDEVQMEEIISEPIQVLQWGLYSLPSDQVSITNAVIVTQSLKWPLIIDPQMQASKWILNQHTLIQGIKVKSEKNQHYIFKERFNSKEISSKLEVSIKQGYSIMIEDSQTSLDPLIEPLILNQAFISQHGRLQIYFNGQLIDYDAKFKLYLLTRDPNPHFLPDTFMKVTVVNFTVTQDGLSDQLLSEIVRLENTDLETQKNDLIRSIVKDTITINKIQAEILNQLVSSSESTILDDIELIRHLETSKITSEGIQRGIEENKVAQVEIQKQRMIYQGLAQRGSILYFTVTDLSRIDCMYQNSLEVFNRIFLGIIEKEDKHDNQQQRIAVMMRKSTRTIYKHISRGLFDNHKLLFSFLLAVRISLSDESLSQEQWNFFLKGPPPSSLPQSHKSPLPILSDPAWKSLLSLEPLHPFFLGLPYSLECHPSSWTLWLQSSDLQSLPLDWEGKLTSFQKLLAVKTLREHNLPEKIRAYVHSELGHEFSSQTISDIEEAYEESTPYTPIMLIFQEGAEPSENVHRMYQRHIDKVDDSIQVVSMGQGQNKRAIQVIEKAKKSGQWVLLQNCNLYQSFLPCLEKEIELIGDNYVHSNFRLFLTTMPCEGFPSALLEQSIKICYEQANGIKQSMKSSIHQMKDIPERDSTEDNQRLNKMTYRMCFFHAVVLERRKFGPLGWNIRYQFNESDLNIALSTLKEMLQDDILLEDQFILWDSIKQIIGDIIYGGRVTDDIDRRTLNTILRQFLSEDSKTSKSTFYKDYVVSNENSFLNDMLDHVESLSDVDIPEIFGMSNLANIKSNKIQSNILMDALLQVQSKQLIQEYSQTSIKVIANQIVQNLPGEIKRDAQNKELFNVSKDGLVSSMAVFLSHEIERFNQLIKVIEISIENLFKALQGLIVINEEIEDLMNSLIINKVPSLWQKYSYPSLKPLASWTQNLIERLDFIKFWMIKGKPGAYWLSAFFFPQGFLTSILQNYSRKNRVAIDSLTFSFEISPYNKQQQLDQIELDRPATEGVYINGLFIESACITAQYIEDLPKSKNKLQYEAPMILFKPIQEDQRLPVPFGEYAYSCPLYKTSERAGTLQTTGHSTNFIINIELPSKKHSRHWILQGTALLCQLDD